MKTDADTPKLTRAQWILYIICGLMALLIAGYLQRSSATSVDLPKITEVGKDSELQKITEEQLTTLQNPFAQLGYGTVTTPSSTCNAIHDQTMQTLVICTASVNAYDTIDNLKVSKDQLVQQATDLQNTLKQQGWEGQYTDDGDYTSLHKLVTSITNGIDYQPDAAYMKTIGDVQCIFDSNTAFSVPKPPAMSSRFMCSRTTSSADY